MHRAIQTRASTWREMLRAKLMWILSAIWGLIGVADLLKAEFLPNRFQSYTAIRAISFLSWRSWLVVFFILLIGAVLEGGHAAIQKREGKIEQQAIENVELRKKLQEALDQHDGPKIHLVWDTPKDFRAVGSKQQRLIIENRSSIDAHHVKIEDVWLDQNKIVFAAFDDVSSLSHNSAILAPVKIHGPVDREYVDDFEAMFSQVKDEEILSRYHHIDGRKYHWVKFPIFVTFGEYEGTIKYRSEFLFILDRTTMGLGTEIQFVRCQKS